MRRKDLDYILITAMLLSGAYATLSGLVADLFGFPQFFLHRYAGYLCAALTLVHFTLNGRRITLYLRHRWRKAEQTPRTSTPVREQVRPSGRRQFLIGGAAAAVGFIVGRALPARVRPQPSLDTTDLGELYHQWSKPGYSHILGVVSDWGERPEQYRAYPETQKITLPDPRGYRGLSLEEAIGTRRSIRNYTTVGLSLEELSRLLYAAQGITARQGLRASPSAGALYPIELYPVVHNVAGLEPGLYHYAVREHALELLRQGDLRAAVVKASLGQGFLGQAGVCFALTALFQRTRWRYRERTYRYVLLEAGHIGQNLYLAATSMGLGACAIGAFLDDEWNNLLQVDGVTEAVVYVISVGST
ncbi:MAG: SagB/ThcOx family dehydrogenase [Anaerolineae bacterium]|nr:SagB/ThcOx family dehydrogenase [Anaerolineae bacterium]